MKHSPLVVICIGVAISTAELPSLATNNASGCTAQRDHLEEGGPISTSAPVDNDHEWAIMAVPQANAYTKREKEFGAQGAGYTVEITGLANSDRKRMAVYRMASLISSFILDTATLRVFRGRLEHVAPRCSSYASVQQTWRLKNEN